MGSSYGGVTASGKKTSRAHVKEDKKLLKDRIKLEKRQIKVDKKHSKDHATNMSKSKRTVSSLQKQLRTKGQSTNLGKY